jgi:1-acyl-sn-glycerol-3-phosphate acyltransferase
VLSRHWRHELKRWGFNIGKESTLAKRRPAHLSYPPAPWREIVPWLVEAYLLRAVQIETSGSEVRIPKRGALVAVFAPHSGWIESIVIDESFRRVGRGRPVWLTKAENRSLPRILSGDRIVCVDRQHPEPSAIRTIHRLLEQPDIALASSLEGTRFGNPQDPEDITTLGEFKMGMVRFAIGARVPILPAVVLGAERVAPHLEQVWRSQGILGAYHQFRQLTAHPERIQVRFLLPYLDHLQEEGDLRGSRLRRRAAFYTTRLRQVLIAQILELDPNYPLGSCQAAMAKMPHQLPILE